jgi:hypothetical protein
MFGYHKAKRERKRAKREMEDLKKQQEAWQVQKPEVEKERENYVQQAATDQAQKYREERKTAREEGRKYAEEVLNRDVQGLTPSQRLAMEEGGSRKINRQMQGYERKLLAQQGRGGVRGGAAYAQQADLARAGSEAQAQHLSDIGQMDADIALKKLAAMFNIEQGEASQAQLDRQLALDELRLEEERKRQRYYEDKFNQNYSRI